MITIGCDNCRQLFELLVTALGVLDGTSAHISFVAPEVDLATEQSMTSEWIHSELERLGFHQGKFLK